MPPSRGVNTLTNQVETVVTKPHCGRQALYNAACFYALRGEGEKETAFRYLYRSIYEPEGGTWSSQWLEQDPDLESLRTDTRWPQLREELGLRGAPPGGSPARTVYDVTTHPDGWQVKERGHTSASVVERTKALAVYEGRRVAEAHQPSQLVVHRADGTFQSEHLYGGTTDPPGS